MSNAIIWRRSQHTSCNSRRTFTDVRRTAASTSYWSWFVTFGWINRPQWLWPANTQTFLHPTALMYNAQPPLAGYRASPQPASQQPDVSQLTHRHIAVSAPTERHTAHRRKTLEVVLYRYIENIEISIRYRYIVSYRIAGRNIEIFDISRYHFDISFCRIFIHLFILASIWQSFTYLCPLLKTVKWNTNQHIEQTLHLLLIERIATAFH